MQKLLAIGIIALSTGLVACESANNSPSSVPAAGVPGDAEPDQTRLRRPPPVRTGISSDPDNPSGAPGYSTGSRRI